LFLIFFHSGICVDFLGTHMISLVLFFRKPGVTVIAKGSAFGPLKWGERGGGHGVHADEGAERDRGSPVVALEIG
jgi:hypothetical protein